MANINQRLNGLTPLSYLGDNAVQPPEFVTKARPPTSTDSKNFYLGDIWLDTSGYPGTLPTNEDIYMLVALVGNTATWVNFGGGDLETLTGNSGGAVSPDGADNINILGDTTTINVVGNPGTNTLTISTVGTGVVNTLTGNSGGAVSPTAGNINVLGTGVITVVGNPGTSTLTVTPSGTIASSFPTDSGTATPALGVLNVLGGTAARDINTSGAGNTIHVDLNNAITLGDLANIAPGTAALTVSTGDIQLTRSNQAATTNQKITFLTNSGQDGNISMFLNNVFIGQLAGNTTMTAGVALFNVGIGSSSSSAITTGERNTALGSSSNAALTTGSNNTSIGYAAFDGLTTGSQNVQIGASNVASSVTTGSNNTLVGFGAGDNYTGAESGNILIGSGVLGTAGESNVTKIANIRGVTTTNADAIAVLIDSAGQLGTISSSIAYKDNVQDMADASSAIMNLRPVTFNYKVDVHKRTNYGLIAEEVDKVMPELVAHDADGEIYSVRYNDIIPMLLNEIQKLAKRVEELEKK